MITKNKKKIFLGLLAVCIKSATVAADSSLQGLKAAHKPLSETFKNVPYRLTVDFWAYAGESGIVQNAISEASKKGLNPCPNNVYGALDGTFYSNKIQADEFSKSYILQRYEVATQTKEIKDFVDRYLHTDREKDNKSDVVREMPGDHTILPLIFGDNIEAQKVFLQFVNNNKESLEELSQITKWQDIHSFINKYFGKINEELSKNLAQLKLQIRDLEGKITISDNKIAELQGLQKQTEDELNQSISLNEAIREQERLLRIQIAELNQEKALLENKIKIEKTESSSNQAKMKELQERQSELTSQLEESNKKITFFQEQLQDINAKLEESTQSNKALKDQITSLDKEKNSLKEEAKLYENRMNMSNEVNGEKIKSIQEINKQLNELLKEERDRIEKVIDQANQRTDKDNKKLDEMNKRLLVMTNKEGQLALENQNLIIEIESIENNMQAMSAQITQRDKALALKQEQVAKLIKQIEVDEEKIEADTKNRDQQIKSSLKYAEEQFGAFYREIKDLEKIYGNDMTIFHQTLCKYIENTVGDNEAFKKDAKALLACYENIYEEVGQTVLDLNNIFRTLRISFLSIFKFLFLKIPQAIVSPIIDMNTQYPKSEYNQEKINDLLKKMKENSEKTISKEAEGTTTLRGSLQRAKTQLCEIVKKDGGYVN